MNHPVKSIQSAKCNILHEILREFLNESNEVSHMLDLLAKKIGFDSHNNQIFKQTKKDYMIHMILLGFCRCINPAGMKVKDPHENVEELWGIHQKEAKGYRLMEKLILEKLKAHMPSITTNILRINHSITQKEQLNHLIGLSRDQFISISTSATDSYKEPLPVSDNNNNNNNNNHNNYNNNNNSNNSNNNNNEEPVPCISSFSIENNQQRFKKLAKSQFDELLKNQFFATLDGMCNGEPQLSTVRPAVMRFFYGRQVQKSRATYALGSGKSTTGIPISMFKTFAFNNRIEEMIELMMEQMEDHKNKNKNNWKGIELLKPNHMTILIYINKPANDKESTLNFHCDQIYNRNAEFQSGQNTQTENTATMIYTFGDSRFLSWKIRYAGDKKWVDAKIDEEKTEQKHNTFFILHPADEIPTKEHNGQRFQRRHAVIGKKHKGKLSIAFVFRHVSKEREYDNMNVIIASSEEKKKMNRKEHKKMVKKRNKYMKSRKYRKCKSQIKKKWKKIKKEYVA